MLGHQHTNSSQRKGEKISCNILKKEAMTYIFFWETVPFYHLIYIKLRLRMCLCYTKKCTIISE
jgi:hypothetical protein